MDRVTCVIGQNFGDEGKGLATDFFSHQSSERNESCLNVLYNGGAQRGHTVELDSGLRHIFHHFGAGTLTGAATYLSQDFIVNPILFRAEMEELKEKGFTPKCFVSPKCIVSTPYDMILNQLIERGREVPHGSCGLGILETRKRNKTEYGFQLRDIRGIEWLRQQLHKIRQWYVPKRLQDLGQGLSERDLQLLYKEELEVNYLNDIAYLLLNTTPANTYIFEDYSHIIFEGGQGLLLSESNESFMPNLTPSYTGSENIIGTLQCAALPPQLPIELCYVTRSYITRHGAGLFPSECEKEDINPLIEDKTNIFNPFQHSLRFGFYDEELTKAARTRDIKLWDKEELYPSVSSFITHLNYTDNQIKVKKDDWIDPVSLAAKVYLSHTKTRGQVKIIERED